MGYAGNTGVLKVLGSRMLHDPEVIDILRRRAEDAEVRQAEVLRLLQRHLRADMTNFVTISGPVTLDLKRARDCGHFGQVRKLREKKRSSKMKGTDVVVEETTIEIELHDAQGAADKLCKVLGIYGSHEQDGTAKKIDDDTLIDAMLRLEIPLSKWPPGLVRQYEARTWKRPSAEARP